MGSSFFFYDLETSGFNPREARIMQFGGQRTDLTLKPIGEPVDMLIKMTDDILPDPDAVLVTGITPQMTLADGVTEAEFLRFFTAEIALPDTIFVGFNTIRFDDEFMRTLHYRNFYDPYEWQWQDNRSKWDLLDVVRMTRALRPDGIAWPFDVEGNPTNRLELVTAMNKLDHAEAHNALSDVQATIEVARLIRNKQERLFDYLFLMRQKTKLAELVEADEPFVYTSGRYSGEFQKTTVAVRVADCPGRSGCVLVYDLRHDPGIWINQTAEQLAEAWRWKKDSDEPRLPVKRLQYNHCPAVAPLAVLDDASQQRLDIDIKRVRANHAALKGNTQFVDNLHKAMAMLDTQQQTSLVSSSQDVDSRMYDGFLDNQDKQAIRVVRAANPDELGTLDLHFLDDRLRALLPLYKARNYPKTLSHEERAEWDKLRAQKLLGGGQHSKLVKYFSRLQEISEWDNLTSHQQYLLEELRLYAESILPEE